MPKGKPIELTEQQVSDIVSLGKSGKGVTAIERETGIPRARVKRTLLENGVEVATRAKSQGAIRADQLATIFSLYSSGVTAPTEIERQTGINRKTVAQALDDQGLSRKCNKAPVTADDLNARMDEVRSLYDDGKSLKEISAKMGCSYSFFRRWANANLPEYASMSRGERISRGQGLVYSADDPRVLNVVNRYGEGETLESIAADIDMNPITVKNWLRLAGVETPDNYRDRWTDEQYADMRRKALLAYGNTKGADNVHKLLSKESLSQYLDSLPRKYTIGELSDDLGLSQGSVSKSLKEFDLWDRAEHYTSQPELYWRGRLDAWGIKWEHTHNVLPGRKEIDMYCPDFNIGIEYNGSYWHSSRTKTSTYHRDKSNAANEAGVFLYHIWDWDDPELVEGQLKNLFGLNTHKVGARKCELVEVGTSRRRDFFDANHVQGADIANVAYGLEYEGELVACMSFVVPRFDKNAEWELSRFACKMGWSVSGGASRLFKKFVKEHKPTSILSYSDIAKTRGNLYATLGFELDHVSAPGYHWANPANGDTKTRYQARMKDESTIMKGAGYDKVFDCGNKVWIWNAKG